MLLVQPDCGEAAAVQQAPDDPKQVVHAAAGGAPGRADVGPDASHANIGNLGNTISSHSGFNRCLHPMLSGRLI